MKSQFFPNRVFWRLDLVTGLSHEFKPWANGLVNLGLLSCNEQLAQLFSFWHAWHMCNNLAACKLRVTLKIQPQVPVSLHNLEQFFTLSHILSLHNSHLNTRLLNTKLQANWHGIKPTKRLIKFNLTILIGFDQAHRGGIVEINDTHQFLHIWNPNQFVKCKKWNEISKTDFNNRDFDYI